MIANIDSVVNADTTVHLSFQNKPPAVRYQLAHLGLAHIRALRELDQQILNTPATDRNWPYLSEQERLLAQRRELIKGFVREICQIVGDRY